jgi:hypothetical protein
MVSVVYWNMMCPSPWTQEAAEMMDMAADSKIMI